jgi:hypothetical protein
MDASLNEFWFPRKNYAPGVAFDRMNGHGMILIHRESFIGGRHRKPGNEIPPARGAGLHWKPGNPDREIIAGSSGK